MFTDYQKNRTPLPREVIFFVRVTAMLISKLKDKMIFKNQLFELNNTSVRKKCEKFL